MFALCHDLWCSWCNDTHDINAIFSTRMNDICIQQRIYISMNDIYLQQRIYIPTAAQDMCREGNCILLLIGMADLKVYLQPELAFCICSNRYMTERVTMPSSVSPVTHTQTQKPLKTYCIAVQVRSQLENVTTTRHGRNYSFVMVG